MIDFLFEPYKAYPIYQILLELFAVIAGIVSVWFAKKNNILVYPIGLISTIIYVFLLYKWDLIGDMIINFYYSIVSIIGWMMWSNVKKNEIGKAISLAQKNDYIFFIFFFIFTIVLIMVIYIIFDKFNTWYSYIDTLTSGLFFVAMWAMAKRKLEHWIFWIVGNIISIPLYFIKGYTLTSIQYLFFLILAINGYLSWKKIYNKNLLMS
jgi:nicotinamide mononucleotide transporter